MANIVVTGSASGIGAATRRLLETPGTTVTGIDLHGAEITADLSSAAGREEACRRTRQSCSAGLDALVLSAGLGPVSGPPEQIVRVNYFGAISMMDSLRELLAAGRNPAAVALCSNSATIVPGIPEEFIAAMLAGDEDDAVKQAATLGGSLAYAGSKLALGRALRRRAPEWAATGICLNGVAPGATDTPLLQAGLADPETGPLIRDFPIPTGGFGKPEQVAAVIAFLLSEDARFCCGSIFFVDGGTDALLRPNSF